MKFLSRVKLELFAETPLAFCIRFALLAGVAAAIRLTSAFEAWVERPLIIFNAVLANLFLNLFGAGTRLSGPVISSPDFSIEVVAGCTGILVFLLFTSVVIAFPTTWKRKLLAILTGTAIIFCVNQLRIVSLFGIGRIYPSLFEDLHLYVWQGVLIICVAFYWYRWAMRVSTPEPAEASAAG